RLKPGRPVRNAIARYRARACRARYCAGRRVALRHRRRAQKYRVYQSRIRWPAIAGHAAAGIEARAFQDESPVPERPSRKPAPDDADNPQSPPAGHRAAPTSNCPAQWRRPERQATDTLRNGLAMLATKPVASPSGRLDEFDGAEIRNGIEVVLSR